jgi:hypothetical protein
MRTLLMLAITFLCLAGPAYSLDITPLEAQKIEYLIASVETLENAQFIRNDTAYDGKAAAAHLRVKLGNAGSRVKSAEDFIRLCASVSSMSGRPYLIRYADGRELTADSYLRAKLREYASAVAR